MKKPVLAALAVISLLFQLSCGTSGAAGQLPPASPTVSGDANGLSIDEAIERAAERISGGLPAGAALAVVSFESESNGLSDFIMETFNEALMRHGITVADRRNLDLAFRELNFSLSGHVSDETALSVGKMLGVPFVVTGQFLNLGGVRRLSATAMRVETSIRQSTASFDVRNDRALEDMIAALSRGTTRRTVEYDLP